MDISTVLSSAVFAAVISAWVSRWNAERTIYVENITKERYPSASADDRSALSIELFSRLNPYDPEDLQLFDCIQRTSEVEHMELATRISLLLKHDWERERGREAAVAKRS